jgi:cbb3-type cytochrome oxidase subunit 3
MDGLVNRIANLGMKAKAWLLAGFSLLFMGLVASVFSALYYRASDKVRRFALLPI